MPRAIVHVLASGGIDSCALLGFYLRQGFAVKALFVDFGQPAARRELKAVRAQCRYYKIPLSISSCESDVAFSRGELAGRNAFLIFAALLQCQVRPAIIAIGIHDGTPYYDCGAGFLQAIQTVVDGYTSGQVRVAAPFLEWDKSMIWRFCKEYDLPVHATYSCESGGARPCGHCLSCKDREALIAL